MGGRNKVAADPLCDLVVNASGKPAGTDGLADGSVGFAGLPAGRYVVGLSTPPVATGGTAHEPPAYEPLADQVVDVTAGEVTAVTMIQYRSATLIITKVDPSGAPLAGACFSVSGPGFTIAGCDGPTIARAGPGDGRADGLLVLNLVSQSGKSVSPGTYDLRELRAPDGYATNPDQRISVVKDRATRLTITNRPGPADTGGVVIQTVDPAGATLTGHCYGVWTEAPGGGRNKVAADPLCDLVVNASGKPAGTDGLADGSVGFAGLPAGRYVVGLSTPPVATGGTAHEPPAYEPLADQVVDVTAGEVTAVTMIQYRSATLIITKVDPSGAPLAGACFSVSGPGFTIAGCDGPTIARAGPGDGRADGLLVLNLVSQSGKSVSPGTYDLRELRAPDGYATNPDQRISVVKDRATRLTITNRPGPADTGGVVIIGLALEIEFDDHDRQAHRHADLQRRHDGHWPGATRGRRSLRQLEGQRGPREHD